MQSVLPHHTFEYTLSSGSECDQVSFEDSAHAHPRTYERSNQSAAQQRVIPRSVVGAHPSDDQLPPANPMFAATGHGSMSHPSMQPLSLHGTNGFNYPTTSNSHSSGSEAPFSTGGELSMSPMQSRRGSSSASPNSLTSSYTLLSNQQNQYSISPSVPYGMVPHGSPSTTSLYSPGASFVPVVLQSPLDLRTRLNPLSAGGSIHPVGRSTGDHMPSSPSGVTAMRNEYVTGPHATRQIFSTPGTLCQMSPGPHSTLSTMPRGVESALGHSNSSSPPFSITPHENTLAPSPDGQAPPFGGTRTFVTVRDRNGVSLQPEITARIDKGFFPAFGEWVCYRRNYFTVLCTFDLGPANTGLEPVFIQRSGNQMAQIKNFSLTIAAKADGEDGKSIDLVQHTPKRDKGPVTAPDRKEVKPNPGGNLISAFQSGGTSFGIGHHDYDRPNMPDLDNLTVASFERIQFKKATANNGKRRAAQQYFYIIVELFGKIKNSQGQEENVKIAHQVSSKIIVRGRSPGHYQDERRGPGPHGGSASQFGFTDNPYGHSGSIGSTLNATGGNGLSRSGFSSGQSALGRSQFLSHSYLAPSTSVLHGSTNRHLSDDLMDVDNSEDHQFYNQQDFGGLPSPPTPRASRTLRPSSSDSPISLQDPEIGYLTPLSAKEELKIAAPTEDDRLQTLRPAFSHSPPWALQRDCRPYGIHSRPNVYAEMA